MTRVYLVCLVLFAGASALCGLSWNLTSMIFFRILQAVPGGILPVVTMSMLYAIVPRSAHPGRLPGRVTWTGA